MQSPTTSPPAAGAARPRSRGLVLDPGYRPRLAPHVELVPADDLGHLLHDSETGRYLRLQPAGLACLPLLDGSHSLEELRGALERAAGRPVPASVATSFVASLGRNRMLCDPPERFEGRGLRERLRRGFSELMNLKLDVPAPRALLESLAAGARRLPRLALVAGAALIVAQGLAAATLSLGPLRAELLALPDRIHAASLALLVLLSLAEVSLHELAHGVTLTALGGRVRAFGVGIHYLVFPYTYTNTSDGYRLGRRARLLVSLAGPAVDVALLGLAGALVGSGATGPVARQALLGWMGVQLLILLFNLNPLLTVDGYFVLADALSEPSLRRASFAYWGGLLRRPFGARPARSYPRRRQLVYLGYGLLASAYLVVILGLVGSSLWLTLRPALERRVATPTSHAAGSRP